MNIISNNRLDIMYIIYIYNIKIGSYKTTYYTWLLFWGLFFFSALSCVIGEFFFERFELTIYRYQFWYSCIQMDNTLVQISLKIIFKIFLILLSIVYYVMSERLLQGFFKIHGGFPSDLVAYGIHGLVLSLKNIKIKDCFNIRFVDITGMALVFSCLLFITTVLFCALHEDIDWFMQILKGRKWLTDNHTVSLYMLCVAMLGFAYSVLGGIFSKHHYRFIMLAGYVGEMFQYETMIIIIINSVCLYSGSLNVYELVENQSQGWYFARIELWLFLFYYIILCSLKRTGRPFGVSLNELNMLSSYNPSYSGWGCCLLMLIEYLNMLLMSSLGSILFFGGWIPPIGLVDWYPLGFILGIKTSFVLLLFMVVRALLPKIRDKQLRNMGSQSWFWFSFLSICYTAGWLGVLDRWH